MASKRATNNSSVTSLEDQVRVINQVLESGGIPLVPSPSTSSDKSKDSGRKKKQTKPTGKGKGKAPEPLGTTSDARPGPSGVNGSGDAARQAAPGSSEGSRAPVNQPPPPGNLPSDPQGIEVNQDARPDDVLSDEEQDIGPAPWGAQSSYEEYMAFQQQQQWLWQQQFMQGLGAFPQHLAYGVQAWEEEGAKEAPTQPRVRQKVHEHGRLEKTPLRVGHLLSRIKGC